MASAGAKKRRLTRRFLSCKYSAAEVGFLDGFVGKHRLGVALHNDFARLKDVGAVRYRKGHLGVLLHQEDGGALLVELLDDVKNLLNQEGRKSH